MSSRICYHSLLPTFVKLQIKTSSRNKLKVEDDLRCALTNTEPEIQDLVEEKQLHPSH